jgi:ABC-type proline/glycine betaine transport system ATPase subunit
MQSLPQNKNKTGASMLINKSIETEEGTVKFEGELEPKELDLVLQVGLNYLLQQGALPFTLDDGEADESNIQ